jgi:hypothetical protein
MYRKERAPRVFRSNSASATATEPTAQGAAVIHAQWDQCWSFARVGGTRSSLAGTGARVGGTRSSLAGTGARVGGRRSSLAGTGARVGGTRSSLAGTGARVGGTRSSLAGTGARVGGRRSSLAGTGARVGGTRSSLAGTGARVGGRRSSLAGTGGRVACPWSSGTSFSARPGTVFSLLQPIGSRLWRRPKFSRTGRQRLRTCHPSACLRLPIPVAPSADTFPPRRWPCHGIRCTTDVFRVHEDGCTLASGCIGRDDPIDAPHHLPCRTGFPRQDPPIQGLVVSPLMQSAFE